MHWSYCSLALSHWNIPWNMHSVCYGWFDYNDVIMTTISSQITSLTVVYSTVYSDADQRKPGPVNSPHKGPVTRKMFPFDDVIMSIDMFLDTHTFVPPTAVIVSFTNTRAYDTFHVIPYEHLTMHERWYFYPTPMNPMMFVTQGMWSSSDILYKVQILYIFSRYPHT